MNLLYQSRPLIPAPSAHNALSSVLFRGTFVNRVPGEPLLLKNLNCHCFDPNMELVLNSRAWSSPAAGQWGTAAAFYDDCHYHRRAEEALAVGRSFTIREGMRFEIRALLYDMLNRTYLNKPDSTNAKATQVKNAAGQVVSGFARIKRGTTCNDPRNGMLQARFQF